MAGLNSFRDVIEDMFYNDIFNALSAFIEDNPSRLESNSYRVQIPDEAALSDFKVQFVILPNPRETRFSLTWWYPRRSR